MDFSWPEAKSATYFFKLCCFYFYSNFSLIISSGKIFDLLSGLLGYQGEGKKCSRLSTNIIFCCPDFKTACLSALSKIKKTSKGNSYNENSSFENIEMAR